MSVTDPAAGAAPDGPAAAGGAPRLLVAARLVLEVPAALPRPAWSRAVALLTRQALERALADYWAVRAPGMESCNVTAQMLALRFHVDDVAVARLAHQTWSSLSQACHHHGYDLAATAGELAAWLEATTLVVDRLTTAARA